MDFGQLVVSIVIVLSSIFFILEIFTVDVVALLVILSLMGTKVLTSSEALMGFANPAVITIASLFIISEGLLKTGAVTFVGRKIIDVSKGDITKMLFLMMAVVGIFSIFVNNTPIVVIFIPIALGIASENNISASKFLIPVSFASIFGGTCSLIGTSTNILVSNISENLGYGALTMFEFSKIGVIFLVVGILYMVTVGRKLLPDHPTVSTYMGTQQQKDFVTEIQVRENSPLIGKVLNQSDFLKKYKITIFEVIRGEEIIWPPLDNIVVQPHDILLFKGDINDIISLRESEGLKMLPMLEQGELEFTRKDARLGELLITQGSEYVDRTINDLKLKARYDISVLALQRKGVHLRSKITDIRLKVGDILLVFGNENSIDNVADFENFALMTGIHKTVINRKKAPWAIGITLAVATLLTIQILPIPFVTVLGAMAMVLSGCLSIKTAYKSLNLPVLILIAGMIALGGAMSKTGLDKMVAGELVDLVKPLGPVILLGVFYLFTTVATAFLTNNAVAILLTPIAITTAIQMNLDPKPFIIAVTFGASASFATPIGYNTNILVYGPGNYRFIDYVRVGLPLNILFVLIATLLIPYFWPFYPS
ncbi:MAG: SLC13 family permease [Acidobacteria bacterium]|nr:SLC13 family permease [Acidobacteriota bacterium]